MSDSTDANAPVFSYSRSGFSFEVYRNRIEISDTSGFGAKASGGKQQAILLRNVTAVTVEGLTRKLYITTSDGKKQEFNLAAEAPKARQAILNLL